MQIERVIGCGLILVGMMFGTAARTQAQSTPLEAVKMFEKVFNGGNNSKAAALGSSDGMAIVDEFGQHLWTGKSAFATWGADYDKDANAKGITNLFVSFGAPLVNSVDIDVAYVVCPAVYTYKLKGVPMRESARMAMVLRKEAGVWRFTSQAWAGTVPRVAGKLKQIVMNERSTTTM